MTDTEAPEDQSRIQPAPTAPDSFSKEDLDRLTPNEERRVENALGLAGQLDMHPAVSALMAYFTFAHVPEHLQEVSKPFCDLAKFIACYLPNTAEKTVALRKLLESKDCAVRAALG